MGVVVDVAWLVLVLVPDLDGLRVSIQGMGLELTLGGVAEWGTVVAGERDGVVGRRESDVAVMSHR